MALNQCSFAASLILGVVYGVELQREGDPLLGMVEKAAKSADVITVAGGYLGKVQLSSCSIPNLTPHAVDFIPVCERAVMSSERKPLLPS